MELNESQLELYAKIGLGEKGIKSLILNENKKIFICFSLLLVLNVFTILLNVFC